MNYISWQGACLCLFTGGMLGGLYLACRLIRLLLRGGRLMQAALDVLFCLVFAVTAFVCALALDKGRLRFVQMALQMLGAWGTVAALDPMVSGAVRRLRRCWGWLRRLFLRIAGRLCRPVRAMMERMRGAVKKRLPKRKPKKKRAHAKRNKYGRGRRSGRNGPGPRNEPPPAQTGSTR